MKRLERAFVPAVAVLAVACYALIYARHIASTPIRSDGFCSWAYLPSWFIFHDPTYTAMARDCCGGTFQSITALFRWTSTGAWVNPHPMGQALLMAPFFLIGHALTWWSNLPRDGFSFYYQHADGLAGVAFFVTSVWMMRRMLSRWFQPRVVLATLAAVTFGTNLFHYGTFDSTFGHVYACFLCALLLHRLPGWLDRTTTRDSVGLGVIVALIVLIRHTNAILVFGAAFYGISRLSDVWRRVQWAWRERVQVITVAAVAALLVLPQLALYWQSTGHFFVNPYGSARTFHLTASKFLPVMFSTEKGLFFWSPVLIFGAAGWWMMRRRVPELVWPALVTFALQLTLVATWFDWQFGGSYGHRAFTDMLPFFAIGIAVVFERVSATPLRIPVTIVAALMIALSVVQMIQYWNGLVPFENTTWTEYRELFLRFSR